MKKDKSQILGFLGVLLFTGLVTILVMISVQNPTEKSQIPVEERTTAHQLAIFQAGEYVIKDNKTVRDLELLLDKLVASTDNSREEIGNLSIDAIIQLQEDYDIDVSLQKFMERAEEIARESDPGADYEEITAKVVIILSQEKSET